MNIQTIMIPNGNSLAEKCPEAAKEWDYEKNNGLSPDMFSYTSNQKMWFKCEKDHSYRMAIHNKAYGQGCPYCKGKKVLVGFNDLLTTNPEVAAEWDYEKNGDLKPTNVTKGSNKKVWWKCGSCGREWEAVINSRKNGPLCGKCKKDAALVKFKETVLKNGKNSLAFNYPELLEEWDYEKNTIDPHQVTQSNGNKFWWKCKTCNGEWRSTVAHRTKDKRGCPFCAGQKVMTGFNDLATKAPEIAKEWDYGKNGSVNPKDVPCGSDRSFWWKCEKGHEWKARISNRYYLHTGCPLCNAGYQISDAEFIIYYYIHQCFPDAVQSYRTDWLKKQEIDIFVPSLSLGIEYDGYRWHDNVERDIKKTKLLKAHGIDLIRFREKNCPPIEDGSYIIDTEVHDGIYEKLFDKAIIELFSHINDCYGLDSDPDIDIARDINLVRSFRKKSYEDKSLEKQYPQIAKLWNYDKNKGLKPEHVLPNSNKVVWWKCEKGHEWKAMIESVTQSKSTGCPYCSNKRVLIGFNDLLTTNPEVVAEWDYEKNGDLKPTDVTKGSNKKVWWKCEKGHEWKALISQRSALNTQCPYCSGYKVIKGENDFLTLYPLIAKEWDYEKNGDIGPEDIKAHSGKKYWWKCSICGNGWLASPNDRSRDTFLGCKKCSIRQAVAKRKKRIDAE